MVCREIEIVHGAGHVEIGIGVEAINKAQALVAQIAFHLEIGIEAEGDLVAVLRLRPNFCAAHRRTDR